MRVYSNPYFNTYTITETIQFIFTSNVMLLDLQIIRKLPNFATDEDFCFFVLFLYPCPVSSTLYRPGRLWFSDRASR